RERPLELGPLLYERLLAASIPRLEVVHLFSPAFAVGLLCLQNGHPELAPRLKRKSCRMGSLFDGSHERPPSTHDDLLGSDNARALPLEEVAVDGDVAAALDLTIRKDAPRSHHELGALAEV